MAKPSVMYKDDKTESVQEDWHQVMGFEDPIFQLGKADLEIFNRAFENYIRGSYSNAFEGFSELADKGSAISQYFLGVMYLKGVGALQDFIEAHKWFNIAASKGYRKARLNLDILTAKMSADQVADAQKLARAWVESSAGRFPKEADRPVDSA